MNFDLDEKQDMLRRLKEAFSDPGINKQALRKYIKAIENDTQNSFNFKTLEKKSDWLKLSKVPKILNSAVGLARVSNHHSHC